MNLSYPSHAILFVGGRSTRMGRDKNLLEYAGVAQFVHALELLAHRELDVIVSCRDEQAPELESALARADLASLRARVRFEFDLPNAPAPLAALARVLATLEVAEPAFVLAADMPFVEPRTLDALFGAARAHPAEIVCFRADDESSFEPFPSLWALDARGRARLERALDDGEFGFQSFFRALDAHALTAERPRWLTNVNTPEEWQSALALLEAE